MVIRPVPSTIHNTTYRTTERPADDDEMFLDEEEDLADDFISVNGFPFVSNVTSQGINKVTRGDSEKNSFPDFLSLNSSSPPVYRTSYSTSVTTEIHASSTQSGTDIEDHNIDGYHIVYKTKSPNFEHDYGMYIIQGVSFSY